MSEQLPQNAPRPSTTIDTTPATPTPTFSPSSSSATPSADRRTPAQPHRPPAHPSRSRLPKAVRRLDPMGWLPATAKVAGSALRQPKRLGGSAAAFASTMAKVPLASARRLGGHSAPPPVAPSPRDKRFADPAWDLNPLFFGIRQAYLATCNLVDEVVDAGASRQDSVTEAKARQFTKFAQNVLSPTNLALTNPEVIGKALQTGGHSLYRGARYATDDVRKRGGRPLKVDRGDFEMGTTLAATPGKVVYRNDLVELIQYSPQTERVHQTPLLLSPPWINKYYVMDLAPGRSFAEWAVQHNRTVFVLSYVNPDASMRDVTFEDYLERGTLRAVETIIEITGADRVDVVGLCLGGVSAAVTAAYLAQTRPDMLGTLTLLNTMLDCSDGGELGAMAASPETMQALAERIADKGYLAGQDMAFTFDLLRANDLIFNYVVSRWLKGEAPPAFDMLAWNEDSTHLTEAMYEQYMRGLYLNNDLASGRFTFKGRTLELGAIASDVYVVGAINDHLVPWQSSYATVPLVGGRARYALSSGGHIAGIVNPPSPKAWCEVSDADRLPADPDAWRASAERRPVTWWEDWIEWSNERAGALIEAREVGSVEFPPLEEAPGTYVMT